MNPEQRISKSLRPKIWLSWSSGKDSYAALRQLLAESRYEVESLFITIDAATNHIPMHAVSSDLLKQQLDALGMRYRLVPIGDKDYEAAFRTLLDDARRNGVGFFAFGDLFLEQIRHYREQNMAQAGIGAVFPLWLKPTKNLIIDLIHGGMRALVTSVDLTKLPADFLGRELTIGLVEELISHGCDPCGEYGEFHTFVFDGPLFRHRVDFKTSEPIIGNRFSHLPVMPGSDNCWQSNKPNDSSEQ